MKYTATEHTDWEKALDAASRLMQAYLSAKETESSAEFSLKLARAESDSLVQEDARRFLEDIIKIYAER